MAPEAAAVTSAGEAAAWWRPGVDGLLTSPAAVLDKLGPDPRSQLEPRNARFLLFFDPVLTENVAVGWSDLTNFFETPPQNLLMFK